MSDLDVIADIVERVEARRAEREPVACPAGLDVKLRETEDSVWRSRVETRLTAMEGIIDRITSLDERLLNVESQRREEKIRVQAEAEARAAMRGGAKWAVENMDKWLMAGGILILVITQVSGFSLGG